MADAAGSVTVNRWLIEELRSHLQTAYQTVTGERSDVEWTEAVPEGCGFYWRQPFSALPGAIWIASAQEPASEVISEAFAGLARAFSGLLDREVQCEGGETRPALPAQMEWVRLDLTISGSAVSLFAGAEPELVAAISKDEAPRDVAKTFDLLFDVELPVTVSFGRARVALKDVLKLTTGSIVELNRSIGDPVEVIVNNCVIARGEVVTIEGNFGVRIHQVISRQERLRTLK